MNGLREIRFRYFVAHRFLNDREQPDQILQTRYGFLWLDLDLGFLTVLSRDEHVNRVLIQALARCLKAMPVPVRFDKDLVDKHFSIEQLKRVSHYDPGTGVRQSISGRELWKTYQQEILSREQYYTRPSSLYDEEVADGVVSGLGVTANKGQIYLTRTLPTSVLRAWARKRLPDLISDLKDLRSERPELFGRSTEAINRMRLTLAGKAAITSIVEGLLQADRDGLTAVSLPISASEIYAALAGKYFTPYLRAGCGNCQEMAELCPHCESPNLTFKKGRVTCKACGATLTNKGLVTLRCMDGHVCRQPLDEALGIAPNHWLQKRMVQILQELGSSWSERFDYFHVEGSTLYRLHRDRVPTERLPPTVINYINNYWDRISGQVHAGSGDVIVAKPPSRQKMPKLPSRNTPRTYRNLDLRLRGNASAGYTVEAAVSGGGSVPPQPLSVLSDPVFKITLNSVLQQRTTARIIQAVGKGLFRALFPAPIARLWANATARLAENEGLRIRLLIDQPSLMALPWELAYGDDYLGLRLSSPIVRYLDLADPPKPLVVDPPLRVLVAISQPQDTPPLDVSAELTGILKALAELADRVEVDVLDSTTRDELLVRLRRGYHVLHYIGHGAFQYGQGYLILEDRDRRSAPASAMLLSQMVKDSHLRLAVLNACETSAVGLESPFSGMAHQLVRAGMPAVIAMQMPIAGPSAFGFSRQFYSALADGWPVDAAVQEGRRSIMTALGNAWNESIDWAIPTLYMRATDGVILGT
jgi:hypothetical protein